jgi:phosphoglycerate dehydrogenase-like enzyme
MKILLLEPIHHDAHQLLSTVGEIITAESLAPDDIVSIIPDADAAITRGYGRLSRDALSAGRKLKCVARCGVGTDNIDVRAATEAGIPVIYAPGSTTNAVAEHALMLMLNVARRAVRLVNETKVGNWAFRQEYGMGVELSGRTLGIIGLGEIGTRVAELGQAFGMHIQYWSRQSRNERFAFSEFHELLKTSDFICICVALTPETTKLMTPEAFALMKPQAILINIARGDVIDEAALFEALTNGRLAGAGLDVIASDSSNTDNPLFALDNVIVTPHVASLTETTFRKMCLLAAEQVVRVLRGETPDARMVKNPG